MCPRSDQLRARLFGYVLLSFVRGLCKRILYLRKVALKGPNLVSRSSPSAQVPKGVFWVRARVEGLGENVIPCGLPILVRK